MDDRRNAFMQGMVKPLLLALASARHAAKKGHIEAACPVSCVPGATTVSDHPSAKDWWLKMRGFKMKLRDAIVAARACSEQALGSVGRRCESETKDLDKHVRSQLVRNSLPDSNTVLPLPHCRPNVACRP
ncbi:uncharacterized protein MEPE_04535 [Melanopsichium pennsylvanicum]|uniref:Uncharacterized protein n=1 Tax=Melanopsichium pennsylvanicum TaxID=63383 RepID=A0AAJ4XQ22_9BASI|nr:uncharacterized protein MEPE_04535 [Melanopsichium pennsylvanicum]